MSPRHSVIDDTDDMTRQTMQPKQTIEPKHGCVRYRLHNSDDLIHHTLNKFQL